MRNSITEAKTGGWRTASVKMQWANRPCGLMYRTIFFFTNSCEPELAHHLQTSKMHRNSTSLDSCQHDDINIVTISVARRRWTAPLKPRRPCVKHFTTFYVLLREGGDNLKEKTLFLLIFYGDTAYTNSFKLFLNYKASSEEYLLKFSWLKIEK